MKMEKLNKFLKSSKSYFAMISNQFGYVHVVCRHVIATAVIAAFALYFERKAQPIFMQIFVLALLGFVLSMVMTLLGSNHIQPHKSNTKDPTGTSRKDYFMGSVLLIIATLACAGHFVLQTHALKTYKNHLLSLKSLMFFVGTLQAIAVTFVVHKPSVWKIGFDMNLPAAAYAGIVTSSISYYVFATSFCPLMIIIVDFMGSFILKIFLVGSIIGAILFVMTLYSVLWGKHKVSKENTDEGMAEGNGDERSSMDTSHNNQSHPIYYPNMGV